MIPTVNYCGFSHFYFCPFLFYIMYIIYVPSNMRQEAHYLYFQVHIPHTFPTKVRFTLIGDSVVTGAVRFRSHLRGRITF